MAYDRYEGRGDHRGPRGDDRQRSQGRGNEREERGFFERARDEVQSWFGDDDGDGRGRQGHDHDRRPYGERGGMFGGGQSSSYGRGRDEDYRNQYGRGGGESGGFGGGDYQRQNQQSWRGHRDDDDQDRSQRGYPNTLNQGNFSGGGRDYERSDHGRSSYGREDEGRSSYRPMTGDYGRGGGSRGGDQYRSGLGSQDFNRSQYGRQEFSQDQDNDRGSPGQRYNYGGWGDDDSRRQDQGRGGSSYGGGSYSSSSFGGSNTGASYGAGRSGGRHDDHYSSWRQRQIEDLDRDYDEYRREHQSKFENEFGGWRQHRQTKRQMLQSIQEHAEVVDQNGEHIGTVDKVRGDTIILTKNDPEAGGVHRSFTCSLLERVEGGKVYLSGSKDSIRRQLRTEDDGDRDRDRGSGGGFFGGLFGGGRDDDRRESSNPSTSRGGTSEGPHVLDRSFSGTYDDKK